MNARILFYVQHLLGIGHVKRASALARALCAGGFEVYVVFGGEAVAVADFGEASVLHLPPVRTSDLSFTTLLDEYGREISEVWKQDRKHRLLRYYRQIRPDIILVEHFPFGRRKFRFELIPLFEAAGDDTLIACSVRDILVEGNPQKLDWMIATCRQWFNAVLVHGCRDIIPFEATCPGAEKIADLLHYTGYVVETPGAALPDAHSQSRAHDEGASEAHDPISCNDGAAGEIVVSAGGGAVGGPLMQAALAASEAPALKPYRWRLLTGANLDPEIAADLKRRAGPGVAVECARPDFRQLLAASALSISQAGYNTVMDILATRCRALVIPFAGGSESEQTLRAREFAARGLLHVLEEERLSPDRLSRAIGEVLREPRNTGTVEIGLDGARQSAQMLTHLLAAHRRRTR